MSKNFQLPYNSLKRFFSIQVNIDLYWQHVFPKEITFFEFSTYLCFFKFVLIGPEIWSLASTFICARCVIGYNRSCC
ncbi:hypothetical protein HanXRQr2_Chr11g0471011 [Helianthus annuus]|uniref:Uncharacterized protein n=1 Tax=Helianthus annuus TaxID=4232 RepID=A0A9K3HKY3_HELAN|nr:hypothetical protein HanXRQr2_Chr11g0471011 [Helianthus annuus]